MLLQVARVNACAKLWLYSNRIFFHPTVTHICVQDLDHEIKKYFVVLHDSRLWYFQCQWREAPYLIIISRNTSEEIPHTFTIRHPFPLHDPIQGRSIYIAYALEISQSCTLSITTGIVIRQCSDISLDNHLKCCAVFHFTINIVNMDQ